jgi:ribose 5-phosphate isomerase A
VIAVPDFSRQVSTARLDRPAVPPGRGVHWNDLGGAGARAGHAAADPGDADARAERQSVTTPAPAGAALDQAQLEQLAARALEQVRDGELIGLGSGRAASAFVRALGARVAQGLRVRGVPTSEATARLAREAGVPLVGLEEGILDVTVDGADEVDPHLDLIKGYGGALVRERIVATASRRRVTLVGAEKLVPVLGSRGRLPVEVIPFAWPLVVRELAALGCRPTLRTAGGVPFVTDNGNRIADCAVRPIEGPSAFARDLRAIPGVVDTGLFLGITDLVLVAEGGGIREMRRGATSVTQ